MAGTTQRGAAFIALLLSQVLCANPGDFDSDGDRDLRDFSELATCLTGPGVTAALGCTIFDSDGDLDVDLPDFSMFQISFTASLPPLTTLIAEFGTPADPFLASANVGQEMLITGEGLTAESDVIFPTRSHLGVSGQLSVAVEPLSKDGTLGRVIVPPEAETGTVTLPDDKQLVVQIVPRVTGITGGRGRATTLIGTGFIEGATTARFGAAEVIDGGPSFDDGIDVFSSNTRLIVTVPPEGNLPYEVITEGGSSGRVTDVTMIPTSSETGTSALGGEASANVGQQVTFLGADFLDGVTTVTLEAMTHLGVPYIITVVPESVAADGSSLVFTVPLEARAGTASIMSGGSGRVLQIIPRVTAISGGRGRLTTLIGTGFIEAFTTVRFGAVEVVDGGPSFNDGIDVSSNNTRLMVTVPPEGILPYEVITEGGSSGRVTDVTAIPTTSDTGTPVDTGEASANVGQQVTFLGAGFVDGVTTVTLEAMTHLGIPYIATVTPDNVAARGQSLVFTVPPEARAGVASIMSGGSGRTLQIIPRVTAISGGRGRLTTLIGTGFIEAFTTVRFGAVEVVDGGPSFDDGIDTSSANTRLMVVVPIGGRLPYEVITEGGSSGRLTDVTAISTVADTGSPADEAEASANVAQQVTFVGAGFVDGVTLVTVEAMNHQGVPRILTVTPTGVDPNGQSLVFTVPLEARAGIASIMSGGSGQTLQIVPHVTAITGGRGQLTTFIGTGFIEGVTTIRFGGVEVVDGGPGFDDGIDTLSANTRMIVAVPANGTLPYEVITEGGSSGRPTDVIDIVADAPVGTPANLVDASANTGQQVTLLGSGYVDGITLVAVEAMTHQGVPYIANVTPVSVSLDGLSLVFSVPIEAGTGVMSLLGGGAGRQLLIVPTLSSVNTATPGELATLVGTGFIEGSTTVTFGAVSVVDGGPGFDDGIDVFSANTRAVVTVPPGGAAPVTATTPGGTSNATSP